MQQDVEITAGKIDSGEVLNKIMSFYDNAYNSIVNHTGIAKACKTNYKLQRVESGWETMTEGEIQVSRKETTIGNVSFSMMLSNDGACSITVISLTTNKLIESFISEEGIVFLSYDLVRAASGIKKKHGRVIVPTTEMNKLHTLLKEFEKVDK